MIFRCFFLYNCFTILKYIAFVKSQFVLLWRHDRLFYWSDDALV